MSTLRERQRGYAQVYRARHRKEMAAKQKVRYQENPEKFRTYHSAWRKSNPDKVKAAQDKYTALHQDRILASGRRWYHRNKIYKVERVRLWQKLNPEHKNANQRRYYAKNADLQRAYARSRQKYKKILSLGLL